VSPFDVCKGKVGLKSGSALLLHLSFAQSNTHETRGEKERENEPQDTVFMHTLAKKGDDSAGAWQRKVRAKKGNA